MSTASRVLPASASFPNEDDDDESAPKAERREEATSANRTTRLLHFKVDLPPCFHGDGRDKDSFSLWKARLELAVKACADAQTQDLAAILPTRLSGDALAYWLSLSPDIQQNYELCVAALNYVFGRKQFLLHFQTFVNAHVCPKNLWKYLQLRSQDWFWKHVQIMGSLLLPWKDLDGS